MKEVNEFPNGQPGRNRAGGPKRGRPSKVPGPAHPYRRYDAVSGTERPAPPPAEPRTKDQHQRELLMDRLAKVLEEIMDPRDTRFWEEKGTEIAKAMEKRLAEQWLVEFCDLFVEIDF